MKTKLFRIFLVVIILSLLIGSLPSFAAERSKTADDAQNIIDGILAYELKKADADSVQQWIDGELAKKAGSDAEWYTLALSQNGNYDFSSYEASLTKYLAENKVSSASTRLKNVLALIAAQSENDYIINELESSVGKQGIMSYIFGLHILNNGYSSESHTTDTLIDKILSLRLSDGGWAVTGQYGDVDTTAMAIQALAPYCSDEKVKTAIDKALALLSDKQKENGDFAAYGVNNPESTAQVLVALSSLGIDFATDERFIKNGNDLIDAILLYRLEDGSFSHTLGGKTNGNATVQVFCSMVAYLRTLNQKTAFFILDNRNPEVFDKPQNAPDDESESSESTSLPEHEDSSNGEESSANSKDEPKEEPENPYSESDNANSDLSPEANNSENTSEPEQSVTSQPKIGYKVWVISAIVAVAAIICLVLFISKKRNSRNYILIAVIALIAVVFVAVTDFESPDEHYQNADVSKENTLGTVTISIRCDSLIGKSDEPHIPENGIILDTTEFELQDGDTVYDILLAATAVNRIHMETNGTPETVYIEGINNIYEFDFGDLSGWTYFVNGATPSVGCGEYKLQSGDKIEWIYSCELYEELKKM